MYKLLSIKYSAATHRGMHRYNNEDNLSIIKARENNLEFSDKLSLSDKEIMNFNVDQDSSFYCTVADGIGGANAGELASEIAVNIFKDSISENIKASISNNEMGNFLRNTILLAHDKICEVSRHDPSKTGMGTTIVAASINVNGLCVAWSGDSRAYLWSPKPLKNKDHRLGLNQMELLTSDHSLVWEQVESGDITPEEARTHQLSHIINQNLGSLDSKPRPDIVFRKLNKGKRILLCSDGLNSMVTESQIEKALSLNIPISEIVNQLIAQANDAGGYDNISIILIEIEEALADPASSGKGLDDFKTSTQDLSKSSTNKSKHYLYKLAIFGFIIMVIAFNFGKIADQIKKISVTNSNIDSTTTIKIVNQGNSNDLKLKSFDTSLVEIESTIQKEVKLIDHIKSFNNNRNVKYNRLKDSLNFMPVKFLDTIDNNKNANKNLDLKYKAPIISPAKKQK
ncbi:MAG: protein phosphatase 2C domain-containing protein [Saprospiraceae bacterium]